MTIIDQLKDLEAEIFAPDRTFAQRQAAKDAFDLLINEGIRQAVQNLQESTQAYIDISAGLKKIIKGIRANQLSDILTQANNIVTTINSAANPSPPSGEGTDTNPQT